MNEQEFVQLLRHNLHDLMNELQIVHGYLSINQIDKVKNKVDQMIIDYSEERNLINSEASHLILGILQSNQLHANLKISYEIKLEQMNIESIDFELVELMRRITKSVNIYGDTNELYEMKIVLTGQKNISRVSFNVSIVGRFSETTPIIDYINETIKKSPLLLEKTDNGFDLEYEFNV